MVVGRGSGAMVAAPIRSEANGAAAIGRRRRLTAAATSRRGSRAEDSGTAGWSAPTGDAVEGRDPTGRIALGSFLASRPMRAGTARHFASYDASRVHTLS